ncbi:MAG: ABC transporter permease subunit [Actinomycetota bacterium]|nr:ABC transporter permease subunit [Actinomycetota bacterium]
MSVTSADVRARAGRSRTRRKPSAGGSKKWVAAAFLGPAAVIIGALIIYPTIDTIAQSFQNESRQFVGVDNYKAITESPRILTAIRNTFIWVVVAPALITGFGLIVAVLTERVSYTTAIRVVLFMPIAISGLAAGVLWRLTYEPDPERGALNVVIGSVVNLVGGPGAYPEATVLPEAPVQRTSDGALAARPELRPGDSTEIGLVNVLDEAIPAAATQASEAQASGDAISVVVWRDFKPGGGEPGVIEQGELGLPGAVVELTDASGEVVASQATGADGSVSFSEVGEGPFKAQIASSTFSLGFAGIEWLGSSLVTPALILAFFWMSVGFAVVIIGGGLSALPRDVLEAAHVDGANEWQTFRHVTVPLMRPVIGVVFVTLTINVLKIFDLVYVLAPGASQDEANVIGVEMFRTAFSERNFGVGAAVAVLLFILVIPIMALNLRNFRREA